MEDLMTNFDTYLEHDFHPKPYWKTPNCSECFKAHKEKRSKFVNPPLDWRDQQKMDEALLNPNDIS